MRPRLIFRIIVCVSVSLMLWSCACLADARELVGHWYQAQEGWVYQGQTNLASTGLKSVAKVKLAGGHFLQQVGFDINTAGDHVLDFKNTSIIGYFRHIIFNTQGQRVAEVQGGIHFSLGMVVKSTFPLAIITC